MYIIFYVDTQINVSWSAPKSRQGILQHWKKYVKNDKDSVENSLIVAKYVRIIYANFIFIVLKYSEKKGGILSYRPS